MTRSWKSPIKVLIRLEGGGGDDILAGLAGDDSFVIAGSGDLGTDTILELSGEGIDSVDFSEVDFGVGVSFDTTTQSYGIDDGNGNRISLNTGQAELENITGTAFDDVFLVNLSGQQLTGGLGNDTFVFEIDPSQINHASVVETPNGGIDTFDFSQLDEG